ncbi:hypothetical protein, partial [Streptococcus iniae]
MDKKQLKRVELVTKINWRYYLVSIGGKYYILDYANPNNIKDYLVGFFPEQLEKFDLYDVTDEKNKFLKQGKSSFITKTQFGICFILYLVHIMIFPEKINIAYITKSNFIFNNIGLFMAMSIVFLFILILLLNIKIKPIDFSKYESFKLISTEHKKKNPLLVLGAI